MSTDETGLGATIRAWRDRLTPAHVGLPPRRARRAAGLRRGELGGLAGVSVDAVVRGELGGACGAAAPVVGVLAGALGLSGQVGAHQYGLVGLEARAVGPVNDHVPPGMQRVLTRVGVTAVGV